MSRLRKKIVQILKRIPPVRWMVKIIRSVKSNGFKVTAYKINLKIKQKFFTTKVNPEQVSQKELYEQRKTVFEYMPKISVLVPLYNTPEKFLREMIQSVQQQSYENWELCLADGSDSSHKNVAEVVREYQKNDERILYRKLENNLGISENTNACIHMSSGEYIALFDHDDLLHPCALFFVVKAINEQKADFIYTDENTFHNSPKDAYYPHYKPDFSPDTLRSYNYICHLSVFSRELLDQVGQFRKECDGSQDYDMVLRLTEKARKIVHIPKVLYYWRSHKSSVASDISAKPYVIEAAHKALQDHLQRVGLKAEVQDSSIPSTYRIAYDVPEEKKVSILIPNKDHISDLKKCLDSIQRRTTYDDYEIIIIENNSTQDKTFDYYRSLEGNSRIQVVSWVPETKEFNFSKINNFGAEYAHGDYLIFLNNDIEILSPDWIQEMMMFCQRKDVGAAGMMLYYPDDTVQHAGVILGIGGIAGHSHKYYPRGAGGYASRMSIAQNLSAVTAACMMVRRDVYDEIGGFDERLAVAFNDVDLCMKIRDAGYLIVFTPYAEAYHYESKSRGLENTPEKVKRFNGEIDLFREKWQSALDAGDPYYNPNLTYEHEDFSVDNNTTGADSTDRRCDQMAKPLVDCFGGDATRKIANLFLILALLFGCLMIFIEPPFVCPDENAHFLNICRISNGNLFSTVQDGKVGCFLTEEEYDFFNRYGGYYNGQQNTNRFDYQTAKALTERLPSNQLVFVPTEYARINPLAYLLPSFGVMLFRLMFGGINAYSILIVSKLVNLLFYALVIRWALMKTGAFRNTMFMLALMPMSLFQGASTSYDAYLIPAAFLLFACVSKIFCDPEKTGISKEDLLMVCVSTALISGTKIAYLPLLLVLLSINYRRFGSLKRYFTCIGIVLGCCVLFYGVPQLANSIITRGVEVVKTELEVQQQELFFSQLSHFPGVLFKTTKHFLPYWSESFFGILGWLDTRFPFPFAVLFLFVLVLVALNDACNTKGITALTRILSAGGVLVFFAGTVGAMYLEHNPVIGIVGGDIAYGVQGRYFIPAFLFGALLLSNNCLVKFRIHSYLTPKINRYFPLISFLFLNMTVLLLLMRYWC